MVGGIAKVGNDSHNRLNITANKNYVLLMPFASFVADVASVSALLMIGLNVLAKT